MKRARKMLATAGKAIGLCALLLLAVVAEENARGYMALRRVMQRLHAQGEPLTLAELRLPAAPKEGNAGPALVQAAKELQALAKANPMASSLPRGLRGFAAPGRAQVAHHAPVFTALSARAPSAKPGEFPTAAWPEVEHQLANAREPLDRLRQALRQPVVMPVVDYTKGLATPLESAPWHAGHWLMSAVVAELHAQRFDDAAGDIVALLSLADYDRRDRLAIAQLTALTTEGAALSLIWEACQDDGWTDEQLSRMQTALAVTHPVDEVLHSFLLERTMLADYFDQLRRSHQGRMLFLRVSAPHFFDDLFSDRDAEPPSEAKLQVQSWLWWALWSWQDEAQAEEFEQNFLIAARPVATEKSWLAFARRLPLASLTPRGTAGGWDRIAEDLQPRTYWHLLGKVIRLETERQMTFAALALKRYAGRHDGTLPPSLPTLVPDFLAETPIDWMDGQPLRYRPAADGKTFLLYSVGTDGRDDGGDPAPATGTGKRNDFWSGRDVVWPTAVMPPAASP